jgi:hypothetical protein
MNELMAVGESKSKPLYMQVINRILRDMRLEQQKTGMGLSYERFKRLLSLEDLTEHQLVPLKQRLDTLESFMTNQRTKGGKTGKTRSMDDMIDWQPKASVFLANSPH